MKINKLLFLILFCPTLFFFSCEPDHLDVTSNPESMATSEDTDPSNKRMGQVSAEEIPDVVKILENLTESRSPTSKSINHKGTIIQMGKINWVKSRKTALKNYTFPLYVEGQDEFEFYNLIVGVDEGGNHVQSFVRRYELNPWAQQEYRDSDYDFRKFSGNYYTYDIDDFYAGEKVEKANLTAKEGDCHNDGTIGSGSDSPVQNTQLIGINQHQSWGSSGDFSPGGQLSYSSNSADIVIYPVGSYVNQYENYQYQETVSTESAGYVNVGDGTLSAPVLISSPFTVVGVTVTTNYSGGTNKKCISSIVVTTYYVNATSTSETIYTGNCSDYQPDQKGGSLTAIDPVDCPPDDEVVVADFMNLKYVQKRLCLPTETEAFQYLAENGDDLQDMADFLAQHNIADCTDNSSARAFALEAAEALPTGATVDYDLMQIYNPCTNLNQLLENATFNSALTDIQNGLGNANERGYEISKSSTGTISKKYVPGGMIKTPLKVGGTIITHIHSHTSIGYPMFSADDIRTLLFLYLKSSKTGKNPGEFSSILVGAQGTYAISIQDFGAFSTLLNQEDFFEKLNRGLNEMYEKARNQQGKLTGGLLWVLNELGENFTVEGAPIGLYRLNNNGTTFERVQIDENNEPSYAPCQ